MVYRLSSQMFIKIGKNIRRMREKQGRTQEDVSSEAGIEMSYYSKVERGEANPSLEIIFMVIRALHTKSSSILPF